MLKYKPGIRQNANAGRDALRPPAEIRHGGHTSESEPIERFWFIALKYYRALRSYCETDRRRSDHSQSRSDALICTRAFGVNANDEGDGAFTTLPSYGPERQSGGFISLSCRMIWSEGNEDLAPAVRRNRRDLMLALVVRRHPAGWSIVVELGPYMVNTCNVFPPNPPPSWRRHSG